ncbi:MAG: tRNA (adenosine(37)-N6)-threonylcarbamoyltransferase complex dimerization subunit type 1 TsaB [Pelagibacteraceae bacterium]|nr:tRNA (adenosine(37)-N6)-threonylcarbamoyltransferase complex dimerization subunit type 1 TsaB [Pelagibacteraceae bacterium]|tara:strand:+ start:8650 stop:9297 length:648 start_codon:yes stop_codon:yes gene_type:complete
MNVLVFDTSTNNFSLSIIKDKKIVLNLSKNINKTYSKFLIPILKLSLKKSNLDIKEINYILTSLGPGSFTGIRIGIAVAKGIGITSKAKILGYSNMDVLANAINIDLKGKKIVTVIKSKNKDYYFQIFNHKKTAINKISTFSIDSLPRIFFHKNLIFSGDLDIKLINKLKNKKTIFYKKKPNAYILSNLFEKSNMLKMTKVLNPIYVYNHYAKKN